LRRILPPGTLILVSYFAGDGDVKQAREMLKLAEAEIGQADQLRPGLGKRGDIRRPYRLGDGDVKQAREMLKLAEADAYATSLEEAVELCIKAAKGELKPEAEQPAASVTAAPPPESAAPAPAKPKRASRGKSQTAAA
jgi:hypothetical protein